MDCIRCFFRVAVSLSITITLHVCGQTSLEPACEVYDKIECPETKKCIKPSNLCDNFDNCGDNWDEQNCYTAVNFDNTTLPICTWQHLCDTLGCSNTNGVQRYCHCDAACSFINDCCIDYKDICSTNEDDFEEIVTVRELRQTDVQCVTFDRDSYWMVSRCDKDFGIIKEKCENPVCNDTLTRVPVTDSVGISYRNMYCAVCHNVDTSELTAWGAMLNCLVIPLDPSGDIPNLLCGYCSLSLVPPLHDTSQTSTSRKCHPRTVSMCSDSNSDRNGRGCEQYTALVEFEGTIYKNPHCVSCHNKDYKSTKLTCGGDEIPQYIMSNDLDEPYFPGIVSWLAPISPRRDSPIGFPLSIVLDFGSSGKSSSIKILQNAEIVTEKVVTCPEGKVFVDRLLGMGDCVPVSCPDGSKLKNGDCISVFSAICDVKNSNNTINLKVRLVQLEASKLCGEEILRNASNRFLRQLIGEKLLDESVITDESIVCNDDFEKRAEVSYTFSSSADLLEVIEGLLDVTSVRDSQEPYPSIANSIDDLEITKSCLSPELEYNCSFDWIADNEYVLVMTNTSYSIFLNETSEWITADGIIFRLHYKKENKLSGLQKKFEIKICHIDIYLSCPFLTMNVSLFGRLNSTGEIQYLPDGHILKQNEYMIISDDQILVCNFFNQSAMMNITEIVTFFVYSNAQTIVSIVGGVLSLIAVILTFVTYATFAILRNRASRLMMNLVIALFLGQFLLLFGGNQTQNPNACFSISVIAHYAWLAAFAWMNALAFDLDRTFGNPDNLQKISDGRKSLLFYMMYAWGSPLLIVVPCISLHFCQCTRLNFQYGSESACWISDGTANLLTFGVPAAIFLLCNVVLFGHTVSGIRSTKKATARLHKDQSKLERTTKELLIYIKIASLMGFTWVFGYIAAFTDVEALWYIYIILNSLQGLFIFISFICNQRVGLLWSKKLRLSRFIRTAPTSSTASTNARRTNSSSTGTNVTEMQYSKVSRNGVTDHKECKEPLQRKDSI